MHNGLSLTPSLPALSPKRLGEDTLTMHQSYRSLSVTKSKLALISQVMTNVNQEKKALQEVTSRLRKKKGEIASDCTNIKKNHEHLHNETLKLTRATSRFLSDRVGMEKELESLETDCRSLDNSIGVAKLELGSLKATAEKDKVSIAKLEEMVGRLRKELAVQVRERENVRADTVSKGRQVDQLKDKITRLHHANQVFMKQIRASAEELGASRA